MASDYRAFIMIVACFAALLPLCLGQEPALTTDANTTSAPGPVTPEIRTITLTILPDRTDVSAPDLQKDEQVSSETKTPQFSLAQSGGVNYTLVVKIDARSLEPVWEVRMTTHGPSTLACPDNDISKATYCQERRRGIRRGPSCSVCINVGVIERYEERFSTFGLTSLDLATKGDIDNPTVVVASVRFTMVHQGNETIAPAIDGVEGNSMEAGDNTTHGITAITTVPTPTSSNSPETAWSLPLSLQVLLVLSVVVFVASLIAFVCLRCGWNRTRTLSSQKMAAWA